MLRFARLTPVAAIFGAVLVVPAAAAVIDFDGFSAGTPITTEYQAQGVVFSTNGGGPCTIYFDPPEATSSPNILCGADNYADIFVDFVNSATGAPQPIDSECVSVNVISVGHAVVEVRSRGTSNQVLQTFTLHHPDGPVNGLQNVDPIHFTIGPIASFEVVFVVSNPSDGIGIDDLAIAGEGCITPTRGSTWGALKNVYR
jgi:hypothetical protein